MKLESANRTCETGQQMQSSTFGIQASSKAFQILSDQLYTDKPRAIIRELSTNALDGHTAAGKADVPFKVILPTQMDTTLIVRDYGTGLSPEQMEDLYTTYFGSNKTHTNDLVGGLGLGSKSPFAYTDQFTAISTYNGFRRTYAAFINEEGVPNLTLVNEMSSDEGNGFEVQVPVKDTDIHSFRRAAKHVFEYFEVRPEINMNYEYHDTKPTLEIVVGDITCKLHKDYKDSMIMQGPIAYPIDINALDVDTMATKDKQRMRSFFNSSWRIHAPVGTFEITASREALSYNKKTIDAMVNLAKKATEHLAEETKKETAKEKSIFKVAELLVTSTSQLPGGTFTDFKWNDHTWNIGNYARSNGFEIELPTGIELKKITWEKGYRYNSGYKVISQVFSTDFFVRKNPHEVLYSTTARPFKGYFEDNEIPSGQETYLFVGDELKLKQWFKVTGIPTYKELPIVKSKPRKAGSGRALGKTMYTVSEIESGTSGSYLAEVIIDEEHANIFHTTDHWNTSYENSILSPLKAIGAWTPDEPIYLVGVPDSHSRVITALKKAGVKDYQTLKTYCAQTVDMDKVVNAFAEQKAQEELQSDYRIKWSKFFVAVHVDKLGSPALVKLEELMTATSTTKQIDSHAITKALRHLDLQIDQKKVDKKISQHKHQYDILTKRIDKKYGVTVSKIVSAFSSQSRWSYQDTTLPEIFEGWFNSQHPSTTKV